MIECLYLIKNGVPFDIAFSLPKLWRRAFAVTFGEMESVQYDWQAMGRERG